MDRPIPTNYKDLFRETRRITLSARDTIQRHITDAETYLRQIENLLESLNEVWWKIPSGSYLVPVQQLLQPTFRSGEARMRQLTTEEQEISTLTISEPQKDRLRHALQAERENRVATSKTTLKRQICAAKTVEEKQLDYSLREIGEAYGSRKRMLRDRIEVMRAILVGLPSTNNQQAAFQPMQTSASQEQDWIEESIVTEEQTVSAPVDADEVAPPLEEEKLEIIYRLEEYGTTLYCVDCNQEFWFSVEEQLSCDWLDEPAPTRCPSCRENYTTHSTSKINIEEISEEEIIEKAASSLPKPQTSQIPSKKDTSQKQENVSAPQQRQAPTGYTLLGIDTQTNESVQITQSSRRQGLYIIGANGTGKTGLIENLILQDINQGLGVGLLDPHGDLTKAILAKMTKRLDDVILLDINDYQYPFGLNLFTCSDPNDDGDVSRATNKVMHIFKKLWGKGGIVVEDAWGVTLEEILANATMTFLEYSQYEVFTMAEIPLLLEDAEFRSHIIQKLTNRHVKDYWVKKYNKLSDKDQLEERRSTLNRVRAFLTKAIVENIVGQAKTTIDFRTAMDERKIVLVKLDRRMEDVTSLIGSMLIAEILNAAYSRESLPVDKRKQFNLYADEFQLFATEDFATLLTEARKFGIATTIAHQARYQPGMTDGIRAVSLQAANQVVFRVTSPDADELAGGFDITPQEAWEEELEAESVEVTKEEWFERVEEDVPDAEDAVITYKRDVVGHLLHQGHENPAVEQFVSEYLQKLQRAGQQRPELNMGGGIAGKCTVYGKNTEVRSVDYIGEVFKASGYLPNGKYLSDEKLGMFERFYARFDEDNYGVYWYDPHVIQKDLLELNTFLYDAMRGKISDAKARLHTYGFLHGVGHWGLSAYLGFDTYYYVTYCPISPQVKEAYLHIMNFTREYYSRRDVQFDRFGISALSKQTEEEFQKLGEELQKVNQKLETYQQFSLTPQQHHTIWDLSRFNETNKIYQYQVEGGGFSDCITIEDHKRIMSELYGLHDGFPGSEQWNKYQEAHAWAFTKYLCLRATKPIPSMDYATQQQIATLMRQKEAIEQRQDELCGKDRYDDTRLSRLHGWCSKEIKPWLATLFRDENASDLSIKAQVYDAEKNRYHWFIESLLAAIEGLKQVPIQTRESGQYQPRTRKQINYLTHPRETITHPRVAITHPQRAYQDVKNDIANQLSGLPNFTARVKISEIVSHNPGKKCLSCKLLNNLGAKICSKCGTKLPAPNEYTLTTLKPIGGLGKAAFDQRIAYIQTRNRDPRYGGYCRSRKEVEAEITKRQTDSSGGSAPAQPQQPSPQQQQARYARQVPLKKNCQNCGTQNDSDAKFCNQCGTKLT